MEEDPFEGFSDLSEDDFNTIARATQFMGLNFSNCSAPKETPSELAHLRGDSMQTRHRVEFLERTLRQLQQEKQTKEGEVSILRDRLGRVECEKNTALMKTCERLRESEQARRSIEEEYRRSLENLKVELAFKSQEIDSLCQRLECFNLQKNAQAEAGSKAPKLNSQPAKDMVLVPAGFEDFNQKKRMAPLYKNEEVFVAEKLSLPMPPNTEPLLCFQSERALLDEAVACVEYEWGKPSLRPPLFLTLLEPVDITKLMEYDYKEILVRKGDLHKHLARIGDLAAALELSYDECLGNLRVRALRFR